MVSEAFTIQHTLDQLEVGETDPGWNNHSMTATCLLVNEDTIQIESEIPQYRVDKSDINFVRVHFLNHVPDHNCQLGNLSYACSELPDTVMKYPKPAYQQLNHYEAPFHIVRLTAREEVFQDSGIDANALKQHREHTIPQMKVPIQSMIQYLSPDIKTLDDLAQWCAMQKGELQNHSASSFLQFANFTVYVNQYQYFSSHNDA